MVRMPRSWGEQAFMLGFGAIGTPVKMIPTWAKYAAAGGLLGASAVYGLTKGQTSAQTQQAKADTEYHFAIPEGFKGDINVVNPQGAQIDQTQKTAQTSSDYTGLIIAGVIALGAIMLLSRKK